MIARALGFVLFGLAAFAAWPRRVPALVAFPAAPSVPDTLDQVAAQLREPLYSVRDEPARAPDAGRQDSPPISTGWEPPPAADPYLATIRQAEQANGIPHNLLARLLYEESRYRPDIIEGATISSAGAIGIAQIVPRWHPTVNPFEPFASIRYAARYLRENFDRFGSWSLALAAYNWGPTVLAREGFASAPLETRNYVAAITADVGVS